LLQFTCGRCGQTNHNIRSCKNIGVPIRPKKYVAPPTSNQDEDLLAQDGQALNEAEEVAAHVQEGPLEINLSQPNLSQDSDMEFMVNILISYFVTRKYFYLNLISCSTPFLYITSVIHVWHLHVGPCICC